MIEGSSWVCGAQTHEQTARIKVQSHHTRYNTCNTSYTCLVKVKCLYWNFPWLDGRERMREKQKVDNLPVGTHPLAWPCHWWSCNCVHCTHNPAAPPTISTGLRGLNTHSVSKDGWGCSCSKLWISAAVFQTYLGCYLVIRMSAHVICSHQTKREQDKVYPAGSLLVCRSPFGERYS